MSKIDSPIQKILSIYPCAYAIYDTKHYYGVGVQESFYLLDKQTLETVKAMLRYEKATLEMIEKAKPLWFAEED